MTFHLGLSDIFSQPDRGEAVYYGEGDRWCALLVSVLVHILLIYLITSMLTLVLWLRCYLSGFSSTKLPFLHLSLVNIFLQEILWDYDAGVFFSSQLWVRKVWELRGKSSRHILTPLNDIRWPVMVTSIEGTRKAEKGHSLWISWFYDCLTWGEEVSSERYRERDRGKEKDWFTEKERELKNSLRWRGQNQWRIQFFRLDWLEEQVSFARKAGLVLRNLRYLWDVSVDILSESRAKGGKENKTREGHLGVTWTQVLWIFSEYKSVSQQKEPSQAQSWENTHSLLEKESVRQTEVMGRWRMMVPCVRNSSQWQPWRLC